MVKSSRPFGLKDKIGYAAGDVGNNFTFTLVSSYLMLFYTNVWGIDPRLVGILFLVARIVDAFTDVGMGRIVDNFKGNKDGKFRPFIKWGAIPVAVAGFLLFQTGLKDLPMATKIIIMYVTYILWGSLAYTFINIPYGSMASAITPSPNERTELSTFRTLGAIVAGLVIGFVTPYLLYQKVAGQPDVLLENRFPIIAAIYGILAIVSYFICFNFVTERVDIASEQSDSGSNIKQIGKVITNRSLVSMIIVAMCSLVAMLLSSTMGPYLFTVYFQDSTGMSLAGLTMTVPMLIVAPIAMKLSQKIGKKEASIISFIGAAIVYFSIYIFKIENMYVYLGLKALTSFFIGLNGTITWAMITDVIDELEIQNGQREDGTVYAVYSFARKLGQALAGGLGGYAVAAVGFVAGASTQTPEVAQGIFMVATVIPAIALALGGIVLIFMYPLDKKKVQKNNRILADKRTA